MEHQISYNRGCYEPRERQEIGNRIYIFVYDLVCPWLRFDGRIPSFLLSEGFRLGLIRFGLLQTRLGAIVLSVSPLLARFALYSWSCSLRSSESGSGFLTCTVAAEYASL